MGRNFSGSPGGKQATPVTLLDAYLMLRSERAATLNAAIQTELTVGANLSGRIELFTTVTLTADLSARLSASTLENGIISYWKLNGNSTDELGTNTGTDTAITYLLGGKPGGSASFNGTTSKISLPNISAISGASPRTVSMWVRRGAAATIKNLFWSGGSTTNTVFGMFVSGSTAGDAYISTFGWDFVTTGGLINNDRYYHFVAVYDGGVPSTSTIHIYVDGLASSLSTLGSSPGVPLNTTNSSFAIGGDPLASRFFDGSIDDVGIWNRALTLAEIKELYLSGVGNPYPFGNIAPLSTQQLLYWPLDGNGLDAVGRSDATVSGGTFGTGKLGSNGYVQASGNSLGITAGAFGSRWSIAMWLFPTANATQGLAVESSNTHGFYRRSDGTFSWYDGAFYDFTASNNSPLSTWTHVVMTHDAGALKFYYNGVLDPISFAIASVSFNPINVGKDQFGNNYVGTIDEVGVWTRALSAADVTALYNAGTGVQYKYGEATPALATGVVASWKLDGNSTEPVGGFNGADTAITYSGANGKINNGAGFNGSSSFIDAGTSGGMNVTGPVSISCWAKNNNTSNYHMILTRGTGGACAYELRYDTSTGHVLWLRGPGSITTSSAPTIGVFHHIVATSTANGLAKIYVDGVLVTTGQLSGSPGNQPTAATFIGKRSDGFFYDGAIDELVLWDRVLTQTDVTALYNAGTGLQYPF